MIIVGDKKKPDNTEETQPYGSDYAVVDRRLEDRLNEREQLKSPTPIQVEKTPLQHLAPSQDQEGNDFQYIGPQPNEYYKWEMDKPVKLGPSEYKPGRMLASVDAPSNVVSDSVDQPLMLASTHLNYNSPATEARLMQILERERLLDAVKQKSSIIRKQPQAPVGNPLVSQDEKQVKQQDAANPSTIVAPNTDPNVVANTNIYSENVLDNKYENVKPLTDVNLIPGITRDNPKIPKTFPKDWSDQQSALNTEYNTRAEFYNKTSDKPEFVFPLSKKFKVSSTPLTERSIDGEDPRPHHGIDLETPIGTKVYSAGSGTVVYSGAVDGYGKMIIVHHPERGLFTQYGHLSGIKIKKGDTVSAGQLIGLTGKSDLANGKSSSRAKAHLHFETYKNDGVIVNPFDLIKESTRRFDEKNSSISNKPKDIKSVTQGRSPSSYGIFLTEDELKKSTQEMMDRGVKVASLDYNISPFVHSMFDDNGNLKDQPKTSTDLELKGSISATNVWLSDLPPDQAKRLIDLSNKTGINPKLLKGREDEVERQLRDNKFDVDQFINNYPKLSEMMDKDPYLVPLIKDESSLWNTIKAKTKAGAQQAEDMTNLAGLGKKKMESTDGKLSAQEEAQINELNKRSEYNQRIDKNQSTSEWLLEQQGYSTAQMWDMTKKIAPTVGATAASGAAIAGMGGMAAAPFTAMGGAITGAGAGALAGGFKYSYDMESGLAYLDAIKDDENGKALSHEDARDVARVVGAVNAAIETVGEAVVARFIPGVDKLLGSGKRVVVKEVLKKTKSQIYRDSIKKAAKYIIAGQIQEGIEEFTQSFVSGYATQAQREMKGKAAPGSTLSAEFAGKTLSQATEEGKAALAGLAPSLGISTVTGSIEAHHNIRQAAKSEHVISTMAKAASEAKTAKTHPDIAEGIYQAALEDAYGAKNILFDAEDVQAFFQTTEINGEKMSPEKGAEELLGPGGAKKLADALKTGKPVAIKSGKILTKAAQNKEYSKLLLKGRVADSVFNKSQLEKELEDSKKRAEDRFNSNKVHQDVFKQLVDTKAIDPYTANQIAEIYTRNITNLARLTLKEDGTPMTAQEYHEKNPIKFSKLDKEVIGGFVENDTDKFGTINKVLGATVFKDGVTNVLVSKDANPYTFIHEVGHALLERWAEAKDRLQGKDGLNEFQQKFVDGMKDVSAFFSGMSPDKAYKELSKATAKALAEASLEKNKDNVSIQKRAEIAKKALDHVNANGKEKYLGEVASSLGKDIRGKDIYTDIMRPYHEALAEAYEKYLASGQAPTSNLKKIFIDLSSWAISVYKTLKAFAVNTPTRVDEFFGNMLTLDGEVKLQERMVGLSDEEIAGWEHHEGLSAENKAKIIAAATEAKQAIHEKMLNEAVTDYDSYVNLLKSQAWDEVESQVKLELDKDKLFSLYTVLKDGKLPSGKEAKGDLKINTETVSEESRKGLPKSMFVSDGGHDASVIAEDMGLENADQLMEAIKALPKLSDEIEARTEKKLSEMFNDALIKKEITTQAEEWVYSQDAAKVMRMEFDYMLENAKPEVKELIKDLGRMPSNEQLKQESIDEIISTKVKDLDLRIYKNMEQKNRYAAATALSKGDFKEYRKAKEAQIRGHYLYKFALEAKASIRKANTLFKTVTAPQSTFKSSRSIGAIAAAKSLLRRAGVTGPIDDVESIMSNLASADPHKYEEVNKTLQADLMDIPPKAATQLSIEEFKTLFDKVLGYYKQSRLDDVIENKDNKEKLEDAVNSVVSKLNTAPKATPKEDMGVATRGLYSARAYGRVFRGWAAARFGFGTKEFNLVFGNIEDADNDRLLLRDKTTALLEKKYREIAPKLSRDKIAVDPEEFTVDGKKVSFDGQVQLMGMLRHMGNESSMLKYIVGNGYGTVEDQSGFNRFLDRMFSEGYITKEMMDVTQFEWDLYENELKDKTQKAYYEKYGVFHGNISPKELDTPYGKYRGGYAPLEIDRAKASELLKQKKNQGIEVKEMPDQLDKKYSLSTVNKKSTLSRTDMMYPVSDSLDNVLPAMDRHVRFATMANAIDNARAVLYHPEVIGAINAVDPYAYDNMISPFIYKAASGNMRNDAEVNLDTSLLNRASSAFAQRMAVVHLGLSLVNIAEEFYGRVIPRATKGGVPKEAPWVVRSEHFELARSTSPKMKQFLDDFHAQSEIFARSAVPGGKIAEIGDLVNKGNFWLQWKMSATARVSHYYGKYMEVLNATGDAKKAAKEADHYIATNYGYHTPTETSSLLTMNKPLKMLAFSYLGYFNTKANILANEISDIKQNESSKINASVRVANILFFMFIGEAAFSILIRNMWNKGEPLPKSDDDDDGPIENFVKMLALQTGGSAASLTPITALTYRGVINKMDKNPVNDKVGVGVFASGYDMLTSTVALLTKMLTGNKDRLKESEVNTILDSAAFATKVPVKELTNWGRTLFEGPKSERQKREAKEMAKYRKPSKRSKKNSDIVE